MVWHGTINSLTTLINQEQENNICQLSKFSLYESLQIYLQIFWCTKTSDKILSIYILSILILILLIYCFLWWYKVDSSQQHMNGYLKDETEELGPSPYTRAYPATYPAPAPPPSGTPRRTRTLSTQRKGVRLQRVCQEILYLQKTELGLRTIIQNI